MPNFQYQKVPENVSNLGDSTVDDYEKEQWTLPRYRLRAFIPSIVYGVITLSLTVAAFVAGLYTNRDISRQCLKLQSFYSPALDTIDSSYHVVRFNNTVGNSNRYGGTPRPEVDEAWAALDLVNVRSISLEQLLKIGGSPTDVRLPEEFGGGYMASDMYTHELHCLNFIRKATYPEYYKESHGFTDLPHVVRMHIDHCIELLRQFVACQGDVGLYTFQWLEQYPGPYPKFSTWHKCRSADSISSWIKEGAIDTGPNYTWPRVPGSVIFDRPDSD